MFTCITNHSRDARFAKNITETNKKGVILNDDRSPSRRYIQLNKNRWTSSDLTTFNWNVFNDFLLGRVAEGLSKYSLLSSSYRALHKSHSESRCSASPAYVTCSRLQDHCTLTFLINNVTITGIILFSTRFLARKLIIFL